MSKNKILASRIPKVNTIRKSFNSYTQENMSKVALYFRKWKNYSRHKSKYWVAYSNIISSTGTNSHILLYFRFSIFFVVFFLVIKNKRINHHWFHAYRTWREWDECKALYKCQPVTSASKKTKTKKKRNEIREKNWITASDQRSTDFITEFSRESKFMNDVVPLCCGIITMWKKKCVKKSGLFFLRRRIAQPGTVTW